MVVKNMDIWAISGNNKKKVAHHHNGNQVIITVEVDIFILEQLSLHLYTSLHNNIIGIDEYK